MKNRIGKILMIVGVLAILSAVAMLLLNQYSNYTSEIAAENVNKQINKIIVNNKNNEYGSKDDSDDNKNDNKGNNNSKFQNHNSDIVSTANGNSSNTDGSYYWNFSNPYREMTAVRIDKNYYIGQITIPSQDISLPIMSQWSYDGLNICPCRYSGSIYTKDMIIAGHNYSSHFGKLANLDLDDDIVFTDIDGEVFNFKVTKSEVIDKFDVDAMLEGDWDLTLFTCTISGLQRVTVRCSLID